MKRNKPLLFLAAVAGLAASSCQPYNYNGGGILLGLEASSVIMVDAPQVSCRSAHSSAPTADLTPISMDLGRLNVKWTVPPAASTNAVLKLVYVSLKLRTSGLSAIDLPMIIAGQDLNCIVRDNLDGGSTLAQTEGGVKNVDPATITPFQFGAELRIGSLTAKDATKRSSFAGTASVLVYGLIHDPPNQDAPVIGRASFQFNFGGILQ